MLVPLIKKYFQTSSCLGILTTLFLQAPVYAQVIKDGSLPTSVTTTDNLNFTIDNINNKNRAGSNLFHSFKEFSIPTGGSAVFNNSSDVVNIINRVTGGNISNIDGLIKANGNANLFLINPAGIVFGKDAQLDIGGSFFGSTAQSIKFTDDIEFSAIDTTPPLLTINVPLGLQMGSNSAAIKVQGEGYISTSNDINPFSPFIVNSFNGLRVKKGNTLALVGNEVSLNAAIVAADSGRVELGSVKSGLVKINSTTQGWNLDYNDVQNFGDIKLNSKALVDANDSIQLQARNISIEDGSKVFMQNRGKTGEGIKVNAKESIELIGTTTDGSLSSQLLTQTLGIGNAAEIAISSPRLLVSQGAGITTQSFSYARGGDINIDASESIQISEFSPINPRVFSLINTKSLNSSAGGDINISTKQLSLLGQNISSANYGTGNGGNVSVATEKLTILDGGILGTANFGIGLGGDVLVDATSIELIGINFNSFRSSSLSAATIGMGNAGNLTVNTQSLVLEDGGRVDSSTLASGAAGSVSINATDFVEVKGTVPGSINPSLIISSANIVDESLIQFFGSPGILSGDSGNVDINTPILRINNGAEVTVRNDGTGKGGILNINANSILLNSKGKITASTQSGAGGNIDLQLKDSLILRNQSLISAESLGTGNGGNININSPVIAGLENSDIIANAVQGNGGNININTSGLFGLQFRDQLTTDSDITASSQFGVNGTVEINNPAIDPSSSLAQLPTDVVDSSKEVASGCSANQGNSFTVVGKGGLAPNPADTITNVSLWNDLRDLSVINNRKKRSLQVNIDSPTKRIEATGWVVDKQGNIEFVAQSNNVNVQNNWQKVSNCKGVVDLL
jgi:filamentous hemagglutinin family protein